MAMDKFFFDCNGTLEHNGVSKTFKEWAVFLNMPISRIRSRARSHPGDSEYILSKNTHHKNCKSPTFNRRAHYVTKDGIKDSVMGWCTRLGLNVKTVQSRMRRGKSAEEAIFGFKPLGKRATKPKKAQLKKLWTYAVARGLARCVKTGVKVNSTSDCIGCPETCRHAKRGTFNFTVKSSTERDRVGVAISAICDQWGM